jgi:hypothetical protein
MSWDLFGSICSSQFFCHKGTRKFQKKGKYSRVKNRQLRKIRNFQKFSKINFILNLFTGRARFWYQVTPVFFLSIVFPGTNCSQLTAGHFFGFKNWY